MNRIDADVIATMLHRGRLGQGAHRPFRGVVADMDPVLAGDAGNRRDVDDRPATRRLHDRDREFHAEKDAARVDRHQPVPGGGVEQILDRAAGEPGVVDQNVELFELGERGINRRLPFRLARHVETAEDCGTIRPGDVGDDPPPLFLQHIGDDHLGALAGKNPRHAGAHA